MKQVRPKKNLGQHFLTDLSIARRIADTVDACPDIPVLEVGPGMGVMTQYLVEKPRLLRVVEIDAESVAYLKGTLFKPHPQPLPDRGGTRGERREERGEASPPTPFPSKARLPVAFPREGGEYIDSVSPCLCGEKEGESPIIEGDFLRMDLHKLFDGKQFVLTGNYPYDISSQIFFKMLDNRDLIPCCTGMIQREVALRIAAAPGSKTYGILSVLIQAWYDVEYLFTVEPNVFNPPPKVQSAVIRMTRNEVEHLGCNEDLFRRVVKTTFNQRRKMLRVSLRQIFDAQHPASSAFFAQDMMTRRPEQLSISEFVELTNLAENELCSNTTR